MNTLADLEKPPFYTALYLSAPQGSDEGLHSEAISTMLSLVSLSSSLVVGPSKRTKARPWAVASPVSRGAEW